MQKAINHIFGIQIASFITIFLFVGPSMANENVVFNKFREAFKEAKVPTLDTFQKYTKNGGSLKCFGILEDFRQFTNKRSFDQYGDFITMGSSSLKMKIYSFTDKALISINTTDSNYTSFLLEAIRISPNGSLIIENGVQMADMSSYAGSPRTLSDETFILQTYTVCEKVAKATDS